MKKKTVALVLSSGGARGLAHIGVIEALEEAGFSIRGIAGCSMGALIGGVYAKGKLPEFKDWICHLDRIDVFSLMDFTFSSRGFIKGEKVFNVIKGFVGDGEIEELPIPFLCNAVDINLGVEKVFYQGSLFEAIRASASIPTVIKPAYFGGSDYIDGGVMNPIPLDLARNFKANYLMASDVNAPLSCFIEPPKFTKSEKSIMAVPSWVVEYQAKMSKFFPKEKELKEKPKSLGFLDLMNLSFDMMQDRLSDLLVQQYALDLLVEVSRRQCGTFEFYRASEIIQIGKELTEEALIKNGLVKE
ncbi:patatin-like phospholipase family protein [Pararhodonellum marinum]|uniref:patatin-like phospholipase family protein n=1 Tax=Pararhodonellum marinum TaxID=2755358 RepID=UPI00188E8022|nr:patatin-like phospholipase family protein [Pararhodonellum marinum]